MPEVIILKGINYYLDETSKNTDANADFKKWCIKEGVIMPKLEYPAYFNGIRGMKCK